MLMQSKQMVTDCCMHSDQPHRMPGYYNYLLYYLGAVGGYVFIFIILMYVGVFCHLHRESKK